MEITFEALPKSNRLRVYIGDIRKGYWIRQYNPEAPASKAILEQVSEVVKDIVSSLESVYGVSNEREREVVMLQVKAIVLSYVGTMGKATTKTLHLITVPPK